MMRRIALLLALLFVAAAAWVRLAPEDAARLHVDPETAPDPDVGHGRSRYAEGPVYPVPPAEALAALDAIATAEPRTERIAGSPEDGRITWVQRSRLMGYPDYVTAEARAADGGAQVSILSRQRFGKGDMGVNAARVARWRDALAARF